ncbi:hypothetical protein RYX36_022203 [Vicia faba]
MSSEKLPFILKVVFTTCPRVNDLESLLKYAKLISHMITEETRKEEKKSSGKREKTRRRDFVTAMIQWNKM